MLEIVKLGQLESPVREYSDYTHDYERLGLSKDASPVLLSILARETEPDLRAQSGKHLNTPIELLGELANDPEDLVRASVVSNVNSLEETRKTILDGMKKDDYHVPRAFASSPFTSSDALIALASNENDHVRSDVAKNPLTPPSVRNRLRCDRSELVRGAAEEKPFTSDEQFEKLRKR